LIDEPARAHLVAVERISSSSAVQQFIDDAHARASGALYPLPDRFSQLLCCSHRRRRNRLSRRLVKTRA
jgi:hypothetical protein